MSPRHALTLSGFGAAALAIVATLHAAAPLAQTPAERVIFVDVLDANNNPVTDLTAADFQVREDGTVREVAGVRVANEPMAIRLLVDTSAEAQQVTKEFRTALTTFVRAILADSPQSEISLAESGGAPMTTVKFTSKLEDLEKGIPRIFPKPQSAAVVMEAIVDAGKEVAKRPAPRRVILSINVEPSNEESQFEPKEIYNGIRRSGATVWALSVQRGPARNAGRDQVLTNLANNTGGQRWSLSSPAGLEPALQLVARHLLSTYAVTIKTAGAAPAQQTQVAVARPGTRAATLVWSPK